MISYYELNFIEKHSWESGFQIFAEIKMMRWNEKWSFGRHFEMVIFWGYFFAWIWLLLAVNLDY